MKNQTPTTCPACNKGAMTQRSGKHGGFLGCSSYPRCTYTSPIKKVDFESSMSGRRASYIGRV